MRARLFVAVWPPEVVVSQVEAALAPVRATADALRWQPPERWHITVGFLGDRETDVEVSRFARVRPVPAGPLRLLGAGHFGPVVWLGVQESGWLAGLAATVRSAMRTEDRRFLGHVTVARSRTRGGDRQVPQAVAHLASFGSAAWTPHEFTLVRSTTGPRPSYDVIARSPLTAVDG